MEESLKIEVIALLKEARNAYENREFKTEVGLCSYFTKNVVTSKAMSAILLEIGTLCVDFYKRVVPIAYVVNNSCKHLREKHYQARLELINILINKFTAL